MTLRARDFKFAEAIVQRLYLVIVALTKICYQHNMVGFVMEGHICIVILIPLLISLHVSSLQPLLHVALLH